MDITGICVNFNLRVALTVNSLFEASVIIKKRCGEGTLQRFLVLYSELIQSKKLSHQAAWEVPAEQELPCHQAA
ncbi:hypothetical protein SAMN04515695_2069 [Pseudovibrio sp. Tun.PSC04-5.I4]|nr:hypothetical protein SAMN04515695_2069 [Pseudovibrio sp. Tun.PSC04-5.I4]